MGGQSAHARLTELFAEAIDLEPPEARAAMVDRVRAEDPAVAAELAALLAADADAAAAARVGLATARLGDGDDSAAPTNLDAIRVIERTHAPSIPGYELVGVLGRGGMGTVFEARQRARSASSRSRSCTRRRTNR